MSALLTTPDTTRPDRPTARQFAGWAYEAHTAECATCRPGETWCDQGRDYLQATAPHTDLPGYATA